MTDFKLQISIDGRQAQVEAGRLRQVLEQELSQIEVSATGLDQVSKKMATLQRTARGVGKALTDGMESQWARIDAKLAQIQSRMTGLVRAGRSSVDVSGVDRAVSASSKKVVDLTRSVADLNIELTSVQERMSELGKIPVTPLGGGKVRSLSDLFRGFQSPGTKASITRKLKAVEEELQKATVRIGDEEVNLVEAISQRQQEVIAEAEQAISRLVPQLDAINQAVEEKLALKPPGSASGVGWSDVRQQWEAEFDALLREREEIAQELGEARSLKLTGGADELRQELERRRRELEEPLREDMTFWSEWSSKNVSAVAQALRASGQSQAAAGLEQLESLLEQQRRLKRQLIKDEGALEAGSQMELPGDAKGTLVDMVAAERALGEATKPTTEALSAQATVLLRVVRRLDEARLAAEGLSKAEREAVNKLEAAAGEEIRSQAKSNVPLEDTGALSRSVLQRLAQEVQATTTAMQEALDKPITAGAEMQAQGLLRVWEWIADKLVGHSVIPEMVQDINLWLAKINYTPEQDPFAEIALDAEDAATRVVAAFKGLAQGMGSAQVAERIRDLQEEISHLNAQAMSMFVKVGGKADARYMALYNEAVAEARRMRENNEDDEAMFAMGYLPRGFGVGSGGESRFHKPGKSKTREGVYLSETDDRWYKAVSTEIAEKSRLFAEEQQQLDRLSEEIVSKRTQMAVLINGRMEELAGQLENATDETTAQRLYDEMQLLENEYKEIPTRLREFEEQVAGDVQKAREQATAAARAYERSPEGKAAVYDHKAASQERIEAAKAERAMVTQEARAAAQARIEEEKRLTAESVAASKRRLAQDEAEQRRLTSDTEAGNRAKQAQKVEAAKRVTLKARAQRQAEIEEEKRATLDAVAAAKEREQVAKQETETVKQRAILLRAEAAEVKRVAQLTGTAQQLAAELGLNWDDVQDEMEQSGDTIDTVVGRLRRAYEEQRRIRREANDSEGSYRGVYGWVRKFANELNEARQKTQGLTQFANDLDQIGRAGQFQVTAMLGSLTLAARDYVDYAQEVANASRALLLDPELTRELENQVALSSADFALLDPSETAQGVTVWAQATGQLIEDTDDLQAMLKQTLPVQQLAALSSENIGQVTEGVAAAQGQFNLRMEDTNRIVAVFAQVADNTIASVSSVSDAFTYVGPQAQNMGEEIEDAAAVLTSLANAGIEGSMAGTSYRMMLVQMSRQTKVAQSALQELFGTVENPFFDDDGRFIGMAEAIDKLAAATENMTEEERSLALSQIFDSRALTSVNALLDEQVEGRKRGINVLRAQAKLARGIVDEETQAYGEMKQDLQGVTVAQLGAVDLWEEKLANWEESDVHRVRQAEMRWKAFWLALGANTLDAVMPALDAGSRILEKFTRWMQDDPVAGRLTGTAVVALLTAGGIATVVRAVGLTVRGIAALQALSKAWQATMAAQQTAGTTFNATVTAAGEQFAALVTQAAQTAAATEQAGAEVETATEVAGGEVETATEVAGGKAETAIEIAGAQVETATEVAGSGVGAAAAGGATAAGGAAAAASGGTLGPLALALSGFLAGGLGHEALSRTRFGKALGMQEGTAGKALSILAYGAGMIFNREDEWAEAVARFTGVIDDGADEVDDSLGSLADSWRGYNTLAAMGLSGGGASYGIYPTPDSGAWLTDKQSSAVEAYEDYLKQHAQAVKDYNKQIAQLGEDLESELSELRTNYEAQRSELTGDYHQAMAKAEEAYHRERQQALEDHQKEMRRMEEDHYMTLWDLSIDRDAAGLYKEKQRYATETRRAAEDFNDDQARRAEEFQREQAARQEEYTQRLAELQEEYARERAETLQAYAQRKADLAEQHREELVEMRQAAYEKIRDIQGYNALERATMNRHQQALLRDMGLWLQNNHRLWQNYVKNLPTPQYSRTIRGRARAAGGYAGFGVYTLGEAGREFVLNANTTQRLEQQVGGPLTQGNVGRGGGITIQASFTGMGSPDRAWFETRLQDFGRELAKMIEVS
ncbi:MAG: phage tail tape measure protein [Anaerolineae bacterium]|nr:phage tail tape measure protein [Anaerolineae bacterium]